MPSVPNFDIARYIDLFVGWLTSTFGFLFDFISLVLGSLIENVERVLLAPPELVLAVLFAALGWWARSWGFGLFTLVALLLIQSMGFWEETMETLALVIVAAGLAVVLGVPIGILAARVGAVSAAMRPVLDFMQTMPAFIYLLVAVIFFAIGQVPGAIASLLFAMPPAVRFTELGIRQVDREVVEAAEAFGAPPGQVLRGVQVPLAMPTIMAGVNQVIMLALSMVVIAGLGGAGGLGGLVVRAVTRLQIGLGFESGLAVVILAIFLDRLTSAFSEARGGAQA
jgi:glycine betaine/proline transport system permease protein